MAKFKVGQILYKVTIDNARLNHQTDGIQIIQGIVKDKRKDIIDGLFFYAEKQLYFVGKNNHWDKHSLFTVNLEFVPKYLSFYTSLEKAKRVMIDKLFTKKWL